MQEANFNAQEQQITVFLRGFFIGGVPCGSGHTPAVQNNLQIQNNSTQTANKLL